MVMRRFKMNKHSTAGLGGLVILLITGWTSLALAGELEFPPQTSVVTLQTNGPYAPLTSGDWWTSSEIQESDQNQHCFEIYVPRFVRDDFPIELLLYDPESFSTGEDFDQMGGASWDTTTFTLIAPNNISIIKNIAFEPVSETSEQWVPFATFTSQDYGFGIYKLYVTTGHDDENSYRLKIRQNNPDGIANNGDEITMAARKALYHHRESGCATYWFYPSTEKTLSLLNFDMDNETSLHYSDPYGGRYLGILSGEAVWNNNATTFNNNDGDRFVDPIAGWWNAYACAESDNPYIFFPDKAVFIDQKPSVPRLFVQISNGVNRLSLYDESTYSITINNAGSGPALHISVTDTIPPGSNYADAGGYHNHVINNRQNYVEWFIDRLAPGESKTLTITLEVHDETIEQLKNSVMLKCSDIMFNDYHIRSNVDVDQIGQCSNIGEYVWADQNGNGRRDDSELGLPGIILQLLDADGNIVETAVTDENGHYYFYCVNPGQYSITMDNKSIPLGFRISTHSLPMTLSLGSNMTFNSANFGFAGTHYPIELSSFTAEFFNNAVQINWITQSETENYGYHLYRSEQKEANYAQITSQLIPGAVNSNSEKRYTFRDETVKSQKRYYYKLADISTDGSRSWHGPIAVNTELPDQYELLPNFPNPFNPQTTISFVLGQAGYTTLEIFNITGQKIMTMVSEQMAAGKHEMIWNGTDESGQMVPSGTYLYRLQINGYQEMKKMTLLK